jgi:peroxiredoxin Q/BCP
MQTVLKEGDQAPDFTGRDQDGQEIALKNFRGKKVILYFYPKDDTPGCTAQACNMRDNYDALKKAGYVILGISVDSEKSHVKFREKYHLPFPLIADTDKQIVEAYGVYGEKKFMGRTYMGTLRTTFIIGEDGKIEKIIHKPDTKHHARQIMDAMA